MPKQKQIIIKGYVEEIKDNGRLQVSIASTSNPDRDDEIIVQSGWILDNFIKNPVLLWSHNPYIPPIGKVVDITVRENKLQFIPEFDLDDDFAKLIFDKYKKGILNTFSVGFMPIEKNANVFTKVELLEISTVTIPANPDASVMRELEEIYVKANKKGFSIDEESKNIIEKFYKNKKEIKNDSEEVLAMLTKISERLDQLEKSKATVNDLPEKTVIANSRPNASKTINSKNLDLLGCLIQADKAIEAVLRKAKEHRG